MVIAYRVVCTVLLVIVLWALRTYLSADVVFALGIGLCIGGFLGAADERQRSKRRQQLLDTDSSEWES